jgi:hypothetical protein
MASKLTWNIHPPHFFESSILFSPCIFNSNQGFFCPSIYLFQGGKILLFYFVVKNVYVKDQLTIVWRLLITVTIVPNTNPRTAVGMYPSVLTDKIINPYAFCASETSVSKKTYYCKKYN